MSKLSDWYEENLVISSEKYNENDISTNERIRNLLFEQIQDLEFDVKDFDEKAGECHLAFRLDFPRKRDTPYEFLYDIERHTLVPQYTKTHRVYRAEFLSQEEKILTMLSGYLLQNPDNKTKWNPKNKRDRNKNFVFKTFQSRGEIASLTFSEEEWENINGTIVIEAHHATDSEGIIVAYQNGKDNFTVTNDFYNTHVIVKKYDEHVGYNKRLDGKPVIYEIAIFNYPEEYSTEDFVLKSNY